MTPQARLALTTALAVALAVCVAACGDDDDGGSEADRLGVGAQCADDDDCAKEGQSCLDFKGGYCGLMDCTADEDCPTGSACVTHTDGMNYCFLVCGNKDDCNVNRSADNEANCSSSTTFVEDDGNRKACLPPSG